MKKLLLGTACLAARRTGACPDHQHPHGERAGHPLRPGGRARVRATDRHRRRDRGRELCRDAHQAGAAAGCADRKLRRHRGRLLLGRRVHQGGLAAAARRSHQTGQRRHLGLLRLADEPGRQGRRRHLHAAILQLRHGPDLSQRPGQRPEGTAGLQGEVWHRAARAGDLGRIHEAGRVFHARYRRRWSDRFLRRGQSGPAAGPDRHGMVQLSLRQRRPVLRRRHLGADARYARSGEGARGLPHQPQQVSGLPAPRASASTRLSTSRRRARRTATSPTTCSAPPTTIPRSLRWSARWRSPRCRTAG